MSKKPLTSDDPPFQLYYSNLYTISYQKMHIASLVQFMPKKKLPAMDRDILYTPSPYLCYDWAALI